MLGLELEDSRAIAVLVNERGDVQARAVVDAAGDLGAASIAALGQVERQGSDARALGIATVNPETPAIAAVLAMLAPRYAGPFSEAGATLSGTAAAVAET